MKPVSESDILTKELKMLLVKICHDVLLRETHTFAGLEKGNLA